MVGVRQLVSVPSSWTPEFGAMAAGVRGSDTGSGQGSVTLKKNGSIEASTAVVPSEPSRVWAFVSMLR